MVGSWQLSHTSSRVYISLTLSVEQGLRKMS